MKPVNQAGDRTLDPPARRLDREAFGPIAAGRALIAHPGMPALLRGRRIEEPRPQASILLAGLV